jgi:BirA family transcriptional regulator, biotin operon repressor / biotin---[acetyl-CoA-carboxylase] ligase
MIATEPLSVRAVRRRLKTRVVGQQLYLFDEVDSTNVLLRRLARSGAAEGTVVLADSQRGGRGRLGQQWFSPAGVNLYASVLFRDGLAPRQAPLFSFIAGLAVADAVRELGFHPAIKWPNDVLVDRKKIAGSLVECATRGDVVDYLVLGVGVNLNVDAGALREALGAAGAAATSLAAVAGHEIDRNAFTASYLNHLDAWALRFRAEGPAPILAGWGDRDILTGRRVLARDGGTAFEGRVLGVNDHGQLIVDTPLGERRVILTEEIRVLD